MANHSAVDITSTSCKVLMSSTFNQRFCIGSMAMHNEQMTDLAPEIYKELIRYNSQETSYFSQPIDLYSYSQINHKIVI